MSKPYEICTDDGIIDICKGLLKLFEASTQLIDIALNFGHFGPNLTDKSI